MMASRLSRGFHRVGIVIAAPTLLFAAGSAAHEAWWQATTSDLPPERIFSANGAIATVPSFTSHAADYTTSAFFLLLAIMLYATARAIGWIADGFLSRST